MTDLVQQAVLRAQLDPGNFVDGATQVTKSSDAMGASVDKTEASMQRASRTTALTSQSWDRFLSSIDPATRAGQQYSAMQEKLGLFQEAGLVSTGDLAIANAALASKFEGTRGAASQLGNELAFVQQGVGALGIAFGLGAVVQFGKSIFDSAAGLEREAQVLGLTTDQLQAYQQSARLAGVDVDVADTAIQRFVRSIGEAEKAPGPARTAFYELGISLEELQRGAVAVLPEAVKGLGGIADQGKRAADEVTLFSRSGQQINPLLSAWNTNMPTLIQHMRDLGLVMGDDVPKAAHDAEQGMTTAWQQIEVAVAPQIVHIGGLVASLLKDLGDLTAQPWDLKLTTEMQFPGNATKAAGLPDWATDAVSSTVAAPGDIVGALSKYMPWLSPVAGALGYSGASGAANAPAQGDWTGSYGTFGAGAPANGQSSQGSPGSAPNGTEADMQKWIASQNEETRLTQLSVQERSQEQEVIKGSVEQQRLLGVAADDINHTYGFAVQHLDATTVAHLRNLGLMTEQGKAAEHLKDSFQEYLDKLKQAAVDDSLSMAEKEKQDAVVKAARADEEAHGVAAGRLVQTYAQATAELGHMKTALVDVAVAQGQLNKLNEAVLVPMEEQIKLLALPKEQREEQAQADKLGLEYGQDAVANSKLQADQKQLDYGITNDTLASMREQLTIAQMLPEQGQQYAAQLALIKAAHDNITAAQLQEFQNLQQQTVEARMLSQTEQQSWDQVLSAVDQFAEGGKHVFKNLARELLEDWLNMLLKMKAEAAEQDIMASIFGGSGSLFGGGQGLLGGLGNLLGLSGDTGFLGGDAAGVSADAGNMISSFGLAGGGPAEPGTSYPVGENGVEWFTPNVPGYVSPASSSSTNHLSSTINVDARGADSGSERRMRSMMKQIAQATIAQHAAFMMSGAIQGIKNQARARGAKLY